MSYKPVFIPESPENSASSDSSSEEFLNLVLAADDVGEGEPSKRRYVGRNREVALDNLMDDYFRDYPKFSEEVFKTRFRMSKSLFLKIVDDMNTNFEWFQQSEDARGRPGFNALQKCVSAIKQLATGNIPDSYDEYLCMSERTCRESLEYFCDGIVILYGKEYLRRPTSHDIQQLYEAHGFHHGLPGMIGSIDCTYWVWRNCPTRWRGQFHRGDHDYPTIILEAVASHDMWFWHAFFGVAGSNNDINVLNQSPIFSSEMHGTAPSCPFWVNGHMYKRGYYLADGIYPSWSTFVKPRRFPFDIREKKYSKVQSAARKDVERAFGCLKAKFAIIARPARAMKRERLQNIMYSCIILHNMILKDEGRAISPDWVEDPPSNPQVPDSVIVELRDEQTHYQLRTDLMDHIEANLDVILSDDEEN